MTGIYLMHSELRLVLEEANKKMHSGAAGKVMGELVISLVHLSHVMLQS